MMKIEALIRPFKLEDVKTALDELGVEGVMISEVLAGGSRFGQRTFYRGAEYRVNGPRVKLEVLVSSLQVDEIVEAIRQAGRTTLADDDGVILVFEVAEAIPIRDHRASLAPL